MAQLGGNSLFLSPRDTHLDAAANRWRDTHARDVAHGGRDCHPRQCPRGTVERFASNSRAPVINALTDMHHPCQLLADTQTWIERRGPVAGKTAAWVGDGN